MARDPRLWKRNLLVIPGGLLAFYALVGLVYLYALRKSGGACAGKTQVMLGGVCYPGNVVLAIVLLAGLVLLMVGALAVRTKKRELVDHLHHGTPVHFGLAFVMSLVVVPVLAFLVLSYYESSRQTQYVVAVGSSDVALRTVVLAVTLVGVLVMVPYAALMAASGQRRRRFLREAESFEEPESPFPGEPAVAAVPGPEISVGTSAMPAEEFVDDSQWPDVRDEPATVEPPAPAEALPDGWEPVPEGKAPAAPAPSSPAASMSRPQPAAAPALFPPPAPPRPGASSAPIVAVEAGCRAIRANGLECGEPVGPGGRYCIRHACQGRTASGAPCRNPALEGATRCRAHSVQ